jgi:hypothetical protein
VATFRRGAEASRAAAERKRGSGKFTPVFIWGEDELRYVQFITPTEETVTTLMHQFIIVGYRENGKEQYERFISRRDPNLDGPDGYDELWDRFGQNPTERTIALALELEPQTETKAGRKVVTGFLPSMRSFERDGQEVEVPNFGLVIESPQTLWGSLFSTADMVGKDLAETVWAIKKNGKGADATWACVDTNQEPLDVSDLLEEFEFDFDSYLDELADEDRMKELISELPDDWKISNFDKRKKDRGGKGGNRDSRSNQRRREATKDERPDYEEPTAADEQAEKPKADTATRSRRFADLRGETKARA